MKKLGLGVLGVAEGRSIISAGLRSPHWTVAGLCDRNEALGRQRCAEFGFDAGRFTDSYAALQAGKHVTCTKPFLDHLGRPREVLDAARRSGRQVMVGQSTRFFAPVTRRRAAAEGAEGR